MVQRLREKLDMQITVQGLKVEDVIHDDLVAIMKNHSEDVLAKYGEDSFQGTYILVTATQSNCSNWRIGKAMAPSYHKMVLVFTSHLKQGL